jgi:hypothetical protein
MLPPPSIDPDLTLTPAALISRKARPVTGAMRVANLGSIPDALAVRGSPKSARFGVAYFAPAGNVTAGLVSGTHRTAVIDLFDTAIPYRLTFTPNKRKLVKKSGGKTKVKRATFRATFSVAATSDTVADTGTLRVLTR